MTEFELIYHIADKMLYAVFCGAIVGLEREINRATAGLKTQILICVGAMLFTIVPQLTSSPTQSMDQARVIAQIVSGVGFLGAGAIFNNSKNMVTGLTTAAWVWFTAAIGVMIGVGHGPVACFTTASLIAVIVLARKIEYKLIRKVGIVADDTDVPPVLKDDKDQFKKSA